MRPVYSIKNQYLGVNAHLHSHWHEESGWGGFHTLHIGHLATALKAKLWPMGYTTDAEVSLQIRRDDDKLSVPRADVAIYQLKDATFSLMPQLLPAGAASLVTTQADNSTSLLIAPIPELLEDPSISERPYKAVAIYSAKNKGKKREKPVAWVELLSPSNKGNDSDAEKYYWKRQDLIEQGMIVVELDYLHETPSTLPRLPDYTLPNGDSHHAHPYRSIVFHPRPDWRSGKIYVYEFDVDAPIPTVTIPLLNDDLLTFDFGLPYRRTFEEMLYGPEFVDYAKLPVRFNRYHQSDQERIIARMIATLQAAQQSVDLETGPFPSQRLPLDKGLAQLKELGVEVPEM